MYARRRLTLVLDRHTVDILAVAGTAAGGAGLLLGLSAQARVSRLRRRVGASRARHTGADRADVSRLVGDTAALGEQLAALRADVGTALRHVAVVRYDAFQDMGGRLSFSAALLDDAGDGLVITAISGRSESRTYAKGVQGGSSEHSLSPEEQQAIEAALRGPRTLTGSRG